VGEGAVRDEGLRERRRLERGDDFDVADRGLGRGRECERERGREDEKTPFQAANGTATLGLRADVAELVDAHGSGPCGGNPVEVQVLSSAYVGSVLFSSSEDSHPEVEAATRPAADDDRPTSTSRLQCD